MTFCTEMDERPINAQSRTKNTEQGMQKKSQMRIFTSFPDGFYVDF